VRGSQPYPGSTVPGADRGEKAHPGSCRSLAPDGVSMGPRGTIVRSERRAFPRGKTPTGPEGRRLSCASKRSIEGSRTIEWDLVEGPRNRSYRQRVEHVGVQGWMNLAFGT
jgi:hypothetical protein